MIAAQIEDLRSVLQSHQRADQLPILTLVQVETSPSSFYFHLNSCFIYIYHMFHKDLVK